MTRRHCDPEINRVVRGGERVYECETCGAVFRVGEENLALNHPADPAALALARRRWAVG